MFATIDIGTNSVLLLIGEKSPDGNVRVVEDQMRVTGLGKNIGEDGKLTESAMRLTISVVESYLTICQQKGVKKIAAVGTHALRVAKNSDEFISRLKKECQLEVEVISGEREAALTYKAAVHDFGKDIVVIDIGGGSTEFVTSRGVIASTNPPLAKGGWGDLITWQSCCYASLPFGCVSLNEKFLQSDPPDETQIHKLREYVRSSFEKELKPEIYARPNDHELVAVSGAATTLISMYLKLDSYSYEKIHGWRFKISDLRDVIEMMKGKNNDERKKLIGLHPERADVIVAGAEILQEAMSYLGYATVIISDHGLRWGLFYEKS